MPPENEAAAVETDVSREAILEAVKAARAKRGDVAAKASELEKREREASDRAAKTLADAEARAARIVEEALGLLAKDPLEAARKFKVDPDKYALARAEDED